MGDSIRDRGAAGAASTAMRSPVNWALLGLVIARSSYGYELAQRVEEVYDDVLPISGMSHIYMALRALRGRSLIEEVPDQSHALRRPRPDYRATPHGVSAYRTYLVSQGEERGRPSQLFARQLAMLFGEPDVALELLGHYERASLEVIKTSKPASGDQPVEGCSELIHRLASQESRLTALARLEWVKYARREFANIGTGRDVHR